MQRPALPQANSANMQAKQPSLNKLKSQAKSKQVEEWIAIKKPQHFSTVVHPSINHRTHPGENPIFLEKPRATQKRKDTSVR